MEGTHYACSYGCGGMSDHMKECETETCPLKGKDMKECHCTDGMHAEVMANKDGAKDNEVAQ